VSYYLGLLTYNLLTYLLHLFICLLAVTAFSKGVG